MITKSKKKIQIKNSVKNNKNRLLKNNKKKSTKSKNKRGGSCSVQPSLDTSPCFQIDAWKQYKQPCKFLPLDGPNQLTNIYGED